MEKNKRPAGIFAAPYTPMDNKGRIVTGVIDLLYQRFKKSGVAGVLINGTTGEGMSLTPNERNLITEKWVAVAAKDPEFSLFVNVSSDSAALSAELAKSLKGMDIKGVFYHSTSYYKPEKIEDLVDLCADVAGALPGTPFYFYYIPVFTNVRFSMYKFMQAAQKSIPNFTGMKFTDYNIMDFMLCSEFDNRRYNMFMGHDETYLPLKLAGANAFIGSSYNYMAAIYKKIDDYLAKGDIVAAKREFMFVLNVFSILSDYGIISAGKAVMKMTGIDCGGVRPPCGRISESRHAELEMRLKAIGFFSS